MAKKASGPSAKKVFIVDDHPVFRDGLVRIASAVPGLVVCGEADNARDAFDAISKLNPDLVLMDINLPGKSGLELLQDVHAMRPDLPVLVISMHDEQLYAERVLRAGGRGYIMKQEGPDKMREAITKVLSGQVYASDRTAAAILDALSRPRSSASTSTIGKLTDRELEILRLTGQGKDNRAIAQELHISLKTVDTHRGHIKEKLGLKNGTELIHYAVRWVGEQV
ncbi:MAG: response regulator transcription factor [Prosthecobacter sp.]|uniref:response regulator n=2 Tax=Prosthecobacter sp. TaxID=1965333 RepID=UPI0025CDEAE1|nr:response regulator transcription factor [Prosthecobacter sp.]MCF7786838.1 response regulator transcription factor [Prosthecobacter sp.]